VCTLQIHLSLPIHVLLRKICPELTYNLPICIFTRCSPMSRRSGANEQWLPGAKRMSATKLCLPTVEHGLDGVLSNATTSTTRIPTSTTCLPTEYAIFGIVLTEHTHTPAFAATCPSGQPPMSQCGQQNTCQQSNCQCQQLNTGSMGCCQQPQPVYQPPPQITVSVQGWCLQIL
jgi:hypothetical protein